VQKAVDTLKRLVTNDTQTIVRFQAATALGRIGKDGKPAISSLIVALGDRGSWEIRKAAAFALGQVAGPVSTDDEGPDMRALRALANATKDVCAQVRLEAAVSILTLGPPAKEEDRAAIAAPLRTACNDRDPVVSIWARVGVMRFHKVTDDQLSMLAAALKNPRLYVRLHAVRAFGVIGPEARTRVGDLIDLLDDREDETVLLAVMALGYIGEPSRRVFTALEKLAKDPDERPAIKQAADEAIKALKGEQNKPKKPAGQPEPKKPEPRKPAARAG
jgi:HEAT repeat protein